MPDERAFTVRLPLELAQDLETVAAVEGVSAAEEVRRAVRRHVEARRADKEFQARLRWAIQDNERILRRLAAFEGDH